MSRTLGFLCAAALLALSVSRATAADSLDVKIGQMIMVGFRGLDAAPESPVARHIREEGIGGVVLFDYDVPLGKAGRNIQSPGQLRRLCARLQSYAGIPLLIGIDQEGGRISRLKEKYGFPPSVSPAALGARNDPDTTRAAARRTAALLRSLGINLNFAPVVDLALNPKNPVIAGLERSYSADPRIVTAHARAALEGFRAEKVAGAIKHFPGHGSSTGDSHLGFTDVTRSWRPAELEPYRALIAEGIVPCVMTAHVFHAGLDPAYPATLSAKVLTGILRDSLRFDGVIISDDMQMKAVSALYSLDTAVVRAVAAGVDLLLFANNSLYDEEAAGKAASIIRRAVDTGLISRERIDASFRRIMALKEQLR